MQFEVLDQLDVLRRYARTLARHEADADDLVHDTLVRALERRATFRSDGNLRIWLFAILHNIFVDGVRLRKAENLRLEVAARSTDDSLAPVQEHVVRLAQTRRALLELPVDQRAALHLVAIEGMSYEDAAEVLSIPQGTLMSRISRARAALRALEDGRSSHDRHLKLVGGHDDRQT